MKIKINIFSFFFFGLMLYINFRESAFFFLTVILHETGHIAAIVLSGETVEKITVMPFGLDIKRKNGIISGRKELFIASGGIVFNIICIIFCVLFRRYNGFLYANILLGGINLLCAKGFDGWVIVKNILDILDFGKSEIILKFAEILSLIILWGVGVLLFFYTEWNISLLCIFFFSFVSMCKPYVNK